MAGKMTTIKVFGTGLCELVSTDNPRVQEIFDEAAKRSEAANKEKYTRSWGVHYNGRTNEIALVSSPYKWQTGCMGAGADWEVKEPDVVALQ